MLIYMNYLPADENAVIELVRILQPAGYQVWTSHHEIKVPTWQDDFLKAVVDAEATMCLLSRASVQDAFFNWIIYNAILRAEPLIPVVLQLPLDIPFIFRGRQHIDMSRSLNPLARSRLSQNLKDYAYTIPREITTPAAPPESPPVYKPLLFM